MDPVSLIVTAVAAGASGALQDSAAQAIKDAYAAFKGLLKRKFQGKPFAVSILDGYEQEPDVWQKPLERQLAETGAADEEAIVRAAQQVLALTDPQGARSGKYNVTISGKGIVVGDQAHVTMTFGHEE
jgi:hypothetical protein